jgi:hypothetical protein
MNKGIQQKMAQYKKMANSNAVKTTSTATKSARADSLSQVIRNKKEADDFMAEVESAFQRAK